MYKILNSGIHKIDKHKITVMWYKNYSRTPLIRPPNYPDRLGTSGKFIQNSTELTCLEIAGYRIQYSTVLWLLELQIRRGRKVKTQVHNEREESAVKQHN